jgi:transcriptional regulator with XRE-family HTH domain
LATKNAATLPPVAASTAKPVGQGKPAAVNPLLKALADKAHEKGHTVGQKAMALGATPGYISQLESGLRQVQTISDDFAEACAKYLGVPRIHVLTMAGRIKPQDFFSGEGAYGQDVERALKFIEADAKWCLVLTPELRASSLDTLYGVVRLYEAATGTVLMTSRQEDAPAQPT